MGRKIPARKHHGVRDPIKQAEQRLALIKDKIDNPPEKKDHQKVSSSLANFIKLKEEAKAGTYKRKRRNDDDGEDKPENYPANKNKPHRNNKSLPDIRRYPNEPDDVYLSRVNRITRESIQESKFESKYGVEVLRNEKTGAITLRKRPDDEFEVQRKKLLKRQREEQRKNKSKKKKDSDDPDIVLTVKERTALAKEMIKKKKNEKSEKVIIEEYKQDTIKFGEIVHAPPNLVTPRKAKKSETVSRPGRKNLLLNAVFENAANIDNIQESRNDVSTKTISKKKSNLIDLKGKRKDLPRATREMIEMQQKSAMDAYRLLKKNKRNDLT